MTTKYTKYSITLNYKFEIETDDIDRTKRLLSDPAFPDLNNILNVYMVGATKRITKLDKSK